MRRVKRTRSIVFSVWSGVSLALGTLVVPALFAQPAAAMVVDRIVAVVNDEIILESDLNQAALLTFREGNENIDLESTEGQRKFEAHRRKTLDQLIEKQLIAQQGKELKISVTADEVTRAIDEVKKSNNLSDYQFTEALKQQGFSMDTYRKQLRQQLLEMRVVNQTVRSRVSVGDDEVRAQYAQSVRQATGDQQQVHLKQILLELPKGGGNAAPAAIEEKRQKALKVVEELRRGGDFGKLAAQYGDDPVSKSGGDLGFLSRGDLPEEIRDVVASMDAGDVRGPMRSERGFHVLQLVEKKDAEVRSFEEAKEPLRRQLYDQAVEKAVGSWTKELRRKAHLDIRL